MKYDHPEFHWSNEFPSDVPEENAITHMGFFFAWALQRGLVGEFHRAEDDSAEALAGVEAGQFSPRQYVIEFCDSQFTNEDFSDTGNAFVSSYYVQQYFKDYSNTFEGDYETIYHVEDSSENVNKILPVLDRRFNEWSEKRDRKPWWKLW